MLIYDMNVYTIKMARDVVPPHLVSAFDKALAWPVRVKAWGWPMNKAYN